MGALCGKESRNDPFSQPGRTVGSAPPRSSNPRAPVPKINSTAPGRTLGGSSNAQDTSDARRAAAKAAEERAARANQPKGKLGRDLAKEKAQTMNGNLEGVSREERRRREIDESMEARNYN